MELHRENISGQKEIPGQDFYAASSDKEAVEKEIWNVFEENKKAFVGGNQERNMQLGAKFQELEEKLKKAGGSWPKLKQQKEIEMWDRIEEKRRNNGQKGNGNGHA